MSAEDVTLRRLRKSDLEGCLLLTQAERWPHRISDWQLHYQCGDGWVVVQNDKVIGVAMWWNYTDRIATVGLVLVDSNQQGRGIGARLMTAVMTSAAPCTLKLMATKAGLKLYQNCGFVAVGEIGQTQGEVTLDNPVAADDGVTLRPVTRRDLPEMTDIDAEAFGAKRGDLLSAVFRDGDGVIATRDERTVGFALIRKSGHGQTIGPVVATDEPLAIALVSQLLARESGFIRLDVDTAATEFLTWLETTGLKCIDTVVIMVRPEQPAAATAAHTYGLVSQAFG